ncbi:MAG: paraslipin [Spirochaetaceae bacterium]|nr:MAG: paraslipin [Spirochaetaceae bacterium]
MDIASTFMGILLGFAGFGFIALIISRIARIVPEKQAFIVEQFGKYHKTLEAGFHIVVPIVQRVAYKHTLKEQVVDVPPQRCITNDNVEVEVDGILYMQVTDPVKASYGIDNYAFATSQLAQTTMRSEMGKIELDRSFSERDTLNTSIVRAVDEASDPWGIKISRYEIKDIAPSRTVQEAMEKQVRAEREKRAHILTSEGDREALINVSQGEREEAINLSKSERQRRVNEAEGKAKAIELVAEATANGITEISRAIQTPKGKEAVAMRIAEQFITEFGKIIEAATIHVLPQDLANLKSFIRSMVTGISGNEGASSETEQENGEKYLENSLAASMIHEASHKHTQDKRRKS